MNFVNHYLLYLLCLLFRLFKAYNLWLEETRLQETNLYVPSLPPQYEPQLLALILQGNTVRQLLNFFLML